MKPAIIVRCVMLCVAVLIVSSATAGSQRIPPLRDWASDHPEYAEFKELLRRHASRGEIRASLVKARYTPDDITGKAQLLAIPPSMPPSKRAFILLEHWFHALYAQLIDDLRVLACFDSRDRLVAYEFF
jgi:hypothetical protein